MEAQCGFTAVTRPSLRSDRVLHCSTPALISIKRERMIFNESSARVLCAVAEILLGNSANFVQALNLYSILGELSSCTFGKL